MKRLTVIIPGYNITACWWRRCVDSVKRAIGPNDEIICVDDGSTEFIMPDFKDVRCVRLERNAGQGAARNTALKLAEGEFVTFVDSDDELLPDVYDKCFQMLNQYKADLALFGVRTVWVRERLYKEDIPDFAFIENPTPIDVSTLLKRCLFEYPVNKIYRKSFLLEHGICFDESVCPGEDTIFNLAVFHFRPVLLTMPYCGYVYYRYSGSSLGRYFPQYAESMKRKEQAWADYLKDYADGYSVVPSHGRLSGRDLALARWINMWKSGSPYGLCSRAKYLWQSRNVLNASFGGQMALMCFRTLVKKYFAHPYLVRHMIRRRYPHVRQF